MKKRVLVLIAGLLFIGMNGFAADGDPIVNGNPTVDGNVGIGTTTPGAKLDVQGGSVKVEGIFIAHVTGTNPTCPSGKGGFLTRKWNAKTCSNYCSSCTTPGGWNVLSTCVYTACDWQGNPYFPPVTCTADTWTEAVCMGN